VGVVLRLVEHLGHLGHVALVHANVDLPDPFVLGGLEQRLEPPH
jgi:hypothetical protein